MNNNIIEIELNNKKDYKNKFNNNRISEELDRYILNETKSVKLKDRITIEIQPKFELTEDEERDLIKMIRLSYKDDLDELKIYEKLLIQQSIKILILGLIILLVYYLSNNLFFISEFILIIGWLLIWEAADIILFSRTENKIKQTRRKQLIHCNIVFKY
ncbi:MAG: hypothetical protein IJD92_05345 [Bacilli bacterium]|nr:hypothetical protein [Bacilli bacterium]